MLRFTDRLSVAADRVDYFFHSCVVLAVFIVGVLMAIVILGFSILGAIVGPQIPR